MPSLRHTYPVRAPHTGEVIGSCVVRMMTAAELEALNASRLTLSQSLDVIAQHMESTTIDIDGEPYPADHAARVAWLGQLRGPWAPLINHWLVQVWGGDADAPDPKS